jgi:hypothetical protein
MLVHGAGFRPETWPQPDEPCALRSSQGTTAKVSARSALSLTVKPVPPASSATSMSIWCASHKPLPDAVRSSVRGRRPTSGSAGPSPDASDVLRCLRGSSGDDFNTRRRLRPGCSDPMQSPAHEETVAKQHRQRRSVAARSGELRLSGGDFRPRGPTKWSRQLKHLGPSDPLRPRTGVPSGGLRRRRRRCGRR